MTSMPLFHRPLAVSLASVLVAAFSLTETARPSVVAQRSTPHLLILNKTDATLAIVDPATNAVLATVPTGEGPHEVAASSDGTTAFVSNYGGRTPGRSLSVIDLASRSEVRRVDLGQLSRPHGLAFHAGKLYVTSETAQLVARYDPTIAAVDARFPTGQATTHMVVISRDGRYMCTANIRDNSVSIFSRGAADGEWTDPVAVPVGRGPEGLDLSPGGKELWTAHSQDGGVSVIDLATHAVAATIDLKTQRSNRLKFTPDGTRVLVSDLDAGQFIVIDAKARKEIARIALGRMVEGILVTPDGTTAYVAENGDDAVAIVDLKTLTVRGRIKPGRGPDGMAWVAGNGRGL